MRCLVEVISWDVRCVEDKPDRFEACVHGGNGRRQGSGYTESLEQP